MPYVTSVDISYNRFEIIDKSFAVFPKLQILNISHNKLRTIDPAISLLNAMHTLNASHNELEMVPDKMGGCVSLSTLLLNNNRMTDFPAALVHLMHLKILDMSENRLIDPKPTYFNTLLRLQEINLSHNQLVTLPGSLFSLAKLVSLDLSHNGIHVLPDAIHKLTSLVTLDVSYNKVVQIPLEISKLQKLDRLGMRDNLISALPDTLTKMKALRRVDFINNLLSDYSPVLRSMLQLGGWNLSGNKIAGEYGNFLKNTDVSLMDGSGDATGGEEVPIVKVEFLVRRCRKLWGDLENIITTGASADAMSAIAGGPVGNYVNDEDTTVTLSFPWLLNLQKWSSDLEDSIRALPRIVSMSSQPRGATAAAAVRALLRDPEFKILMQNLEGHSLGYRPYEQHIFTHRIMKILDLGHGYINIIEEFESLGRTLYAVACAQRQEELTLRRADSTDVEEKQPQEVTLSSPVAAIQRSATMATVEEVEEEMDRRIDELISASRVWTVSSRGRSREGLDGVEFPDSVHESMNSGAMKMIHDREQSPGSRRQLSGSDVEGDEVSRDEEGVGGGSIVSGSSPRQKISQTGGSDNDVNDTMSPMQSGRINSDTDNQLLKNMAVGDISESETGSPNLASKSPTHMSVMNVELFTWKIMDLLYDPLLGNPENSLLFKIAFECYYGLGLALVERGERLSVDIRRIERNCCLTSALNVGQRFGDDMRDLLEGYEALFPKRTGSTASTTTMKMTSLLSSSEVASVSAASLASDEIIGEVEGAETGKEAVDMETSSVRSAGSIQSTAVEDPGDTYLKTLYSTHAKALVNSLMRERRKLYLWSVLVLGCAADALHLYGWDAVSEYAVENEDNTVLIAGKDLRSNAVGMTLTYSKALLGAGLHAMALVEIEKVLRWSPHFRTAEVIRLRCLCALGDYPQAKLRLTDYIVRILDKDLRAIKLRNVMKEDIELGYLMIFIDACDGSLSKTGYGSKEMLRKYDLLANGILERPLATFTDTEHGSCPYNDWILQRRDDMLQTMVMHKREDKDRHAYISRKRNVANAAETAIQEFKELMDNLGPVVINMQGGN